jgi:serine/threonine-protein kinase
MSDARWAEVRAAFDELADASDATRAARLAVLGTADPGLRREVERLLATDADSEERLARLFTPPGALRDPLGLSGRMLSHFRVGAPLGAGGMGVVYAAEDTRLDRMVALKVPLPDRGLDASGRRRFLHEARSAAALDHPNLCAIHEVGEAETGHLFLAMPLYRGETLRARLEREGALPPDRALEIARQVARGLAAAHGAGIVHRDLKPANLMLLPDGLVKVLDFGLAKARATTTSITGAMLGTAAYMAPEQVRAEPVDGRTDLWALGVVLYEMVAGRKPFRGEHEASLAHAIVHDEPAPPAPAGRGLPAGLEALILELLAKDPARRPATAESVEARLAEIAAGRAPASARAPRARRPARALALAAGLAGAGLLAVLAVSRRDRAPASPGDAGLVAVAPFDAVGPGLELWREGLADMLASDLDGAGPLRTVAPSVLLQRWEGRADRPSAERLGARTGAGIVIFGKVMRRGADSIGIRATVLDRARGVATGDIEVAGGEQRIGELADSLGVRILRVLGRNRAIASVRHVSIGSRSLPALKAFLQGEQFYRASEWDSALAHYDRAVTADSTFGLALRRMGWALGSSPPTAWRYAPQIEYMRRAVRFIRGLSPRDSILFVADSLGLFALGPTGDAIIAGLYRSSLTVEELARQYPEDPSAWYELGERRFHTPAPLGADPATALDAFDRAIALDSGFAPAYMHTVQLAMQLGQPDRARGYARAYVSRRLPGRHTWDLHLMEAILDSGGLRAPAAQRQVERASAGALHWAAGAHLLHATDPDEAAIWLLREIGTGRHSFEGAPVTITDTLLLRQQLAQALAWRGHLRDAVEAGAPLLGNPVGYRYSYNFDPFLDLALLGAIPDTLAARTFGTALAPEADWRVGGVRMAMPRYLRGLPWWFARGDSASLRAMVARGAEIAAAKPSPVAELRARYLGPAAAAYLALLRGDSAGAARGFEAIPDTLCLFAGCFHEKLVLARLLAARGEERRAAALMDRWNFAGENYPTRVLAALERARLAERMGRRALARQEYRLVLAAWRQPDEALMPYVREAAAAIERN